jgi:hypothetical protein
MHALHCRMKQKRVANITDDIELPSAQNSLRVTPERLSGDFANNCIPWFNRLPVSPSYATGLPRESV